jgi:death on curing protein
LFLTRDDVLEYHSQQIAEHGGSSGLADSGLLDSALASPENLYLYDAGAGLFDIATAYAFHIAKNHAFYDGNTPGVPAAELVRHAADLSLG